MVRKHRATRYCMVLHVATAGHCPTLTGYLDSKRRSEQTGQLPLRLCSLQRCLRKSSRLMQALQAMQWNESMPRPLPCAQRDPEVEPKPKRGGGWGAGWAGGHTTGSASRYTTLRKYARRQSRPHMNNLLQRCYKQQAHQGNSRPTLVLEPSAAQRRTWRQKLQKGQW